MNKSQSRAVWITNKVIPLLTVKAGQRESEISAQIKGLLKKYNAKPAFRIIVASGKRAAIPHGFATDKIIRQGDLVVIDFGALYNGYRSDITRTFVVGKPSRRQLRLLGIVKKAQAKAIKVVQAGRRICDVDCAARKYIERQGYGQNFVHSTGHGIGRNVHEVPKISKKNRRKLKVGMVITIEPGIYFKGYGGVRIEDMVEVTARGCRVLT